MKRVPSANKLHGAARPRYGSSHFLRALVIPGDPSGANRRRSTSPLIATLVS
jgi:hypothetical protein